MSYIQVSFKPFGRSWSRLSQKKNNVDLLHSKYIHSLKVEKRWIRFNQIVIFLLFFSSWELLSQRQWIDPLLFSSPSRIVNLFLEKLQDGSLLQNLGVTLTETVFGFILGTLMGTI